MTTVTPSNLSVEPTEKEKIEFLEKAIKALGEDDNIKKFKEAMKDLGLRAVLTDEAFSHVKNTMDAFVRDQGDQYPGIKVFQTEWDGYKSEWSTLIDKSRTLATSTAAEYEDYTLYLEVVDSIKNKEEMQQLASDLKDFAKGGDQSTDLKDKFEKLKGKVEDFQKRFNDYLDNQKVELTQEAEKLNTAIKALEAVIIGLDKQIKDLAVALGIAIWWGPLASFAAGTILATLAEKRATKQKELDDKRGDLKKTEGEQTALAQIKAQFAGLIPDFKLLAANLGLFADIRRSFYSEALEFSNEFEKVDLPTKLPTIVKLRIKLALIVSSPLIQALKEYANIIHL